MSEKLVSVSFPTTVHDRFYISKPKVKKKYNHNFTFHMYIASSSLLPPAVATEEGKRQANIEQLFLWVHATRYRPTNIERLLLQDAYDNTFLRHADMAFCSMFLATFTFRAAVWKGAGRIPGKWLRPFYAGLVAYDVMAKQASPCPALECWNGLVLLNTRLGEAARRIHAPDRFLSYKAPPARQSWLRWTVNSLCLTEVQSRLFEGSMFRSFDTAASDDQRAFRQLKTIQKELSRSNDDGSGKDASLMRPVLPKDPPEQHILAALVLNLRCLQWIPFCVEARNDGDLRLYDLRVGMPQLNGFTLGRWVQLATSQKRGGDFLQTQTTMVAYLWWNSHLTLMSLLLQAW